MALELRQQLKLSQQLVMTPQLQQAIKLLQLSRLELVESIQQELMENPLLEEVQEEDKPERVMAEEEHGPLPGGENTAIERELIKNAEWDDYLGDFASTPVQSHIRETEIPEEGMAFDARLSSKPSLEGHLDWQMRLSNFTERELSIGEAICGSLDSSGYLSATAEELAGMSGTTPRRWRACFTGSSGSIPWAWPPGVPGSACWSRWRSLDMRIPSWWSWFRASGGPGEETLQALGQEVPDQHGTTQGISRHHPES
jgi:hypothetical protein